MSNPRKHDWSLVRLLQQELLRAQCSHTGSYMGSYKYTDSTVFARVLPMGSYKGFKAVLVLKFGVLARVCLEFACFLVLGFAFSIG